MPYTRTLPPSGSRSAREDLALRRSIAAQFKVLLAESGVTKSEFARSMGADRRTIRLLLAPNDASLTLTTLTRAARAFGRSIRIEIV